MLVLWFSFLIQIRVFFKQKKQKHSISLDLASKWMFA